MPVKWLINILSANIQFTMDPREYYAITEMNDIRTRNKELMHLAAGRIIQKGEIITCPKCGFQSGNKTKFVTHHRHYRTFGNERPEDVVVLCRPCHKDIHTRQWEYKLTEKDIPFVDPEWVNVLTGRK